MPRIAPALLVCLLACTGPARADDAYPPLDQRLGKTITVVEKNQPTEKAVITQVWRLEDGSPVMQAKTLTSNTQLTLVENLNPKTVTERIKVLRWTNGVRPEGCPVPPVVKAQAPVKTQPAVTQTQFTKAVKETPPAVVVKTGPVVTTEGGLLPVLPKKEEAKAVPEVMSLPSTVPPPVPSMSKTVKTEVAMPSVKAELKVPTPPVPAPASSVVTRQTTSVPAVIKTPASTMPMQAAAQPVQSVPVMAGKPELVGGCEVITVTENGVARKYMVLGTARDKHGVMTQRCQAMDTKEIVTLNCDSCNTCSTAAAPCKPACPPAPVACVPAPVKCEPAKVACAPAAPAKVDCKPCEPAKVACEPAKPVCEPAKPCVAAPAKACDPCANGNACNSKNCGADCGDKCGLFCKKESLYDRSCRRVRGSSYGDINVPVPGVRLSTVNGMPGGPPPQPMVPAFCTMNSSSVRAYMNAPELVSSVCLNQPFSETMNGQIVAGMHQMNGANGEAVANTLHLINVLSQSNEWENRKWAAERLNQAKLPTMRPYVEDALVTAVQTDRATLVKVAAIRTLADLNSTRQDVLAMLAYAAVDADPRIKEAANEAIGTLSKNNGVQQAAYTK